MLAPAVDGLGCTMLNPISIIKIFFLLLCLYPIAGVCVASTDQVTVMENKIESSEGSDKIDAIIDFVKTHYHFNTQPSILHGEAGLELLPMYGSDKQSSELHSYLARAYFAYGDLVRADALIKVALSTAQRSANKEALVLAKLISAGIELRNKHIAESRQLTNEAITLATAIGHNLHLASAYRISGNLNVKVKDYEAALSDYLYSLDIYKRLNNQSGVASLNQRLASLYRTMNLYEKVLFHQNQAIDISLSLNNEANLAIYYSNMGTYLEEVSDYARSIEMHLKSLAIKEKLGYQLGAIHTYNRLGSVYRLVGDYQSAEESLLKALELKKALDRPDPNVSTFLDLGRLYIKTGKLDLAEDYLSKSIPLYQGSRWEDRIAEIYHAFADLHLQRNNPKLAVQAYKSAIDIAKKHDRDAFLIDYYYELSEVLETQGDVAQALAFLKSHNELKSKWDSINNQYLIRSLAIEFGVTEKRREIAALIQQNQIKDLELKQQASRQQFIFISLLLAFIVFSFVYFWRSKNRQLKVEKTALKQVSEAKERLTFALWGSGDELWDWDLQTGIITRDNQACDLRLPSEYIGMDLEKIRPVVHPDDFTILQERFSQHLKGESDYYEVNYRVLTQTGDWLWVLDRGKVTALNEVGEPLRVSGTIKDISRIKASEFALAELNATLEQRVEERTNSLQQSRDELATALEELTSAQTSLLEAQKMASLGRLVAGVSHELNTPLGNSVTASSVLQEELTIFKDKLEASKLTLSDTKSFIEVSLSGTALIESNLGRAAQLVKRFKHASAHEYVSNATELNLKDFIYSAIAFHTQDSELTIEINCSDTMQIECDAQALGKVFEDLCKNSLQHGFKKHKGQIIVEVFAESDSLKIVYSDNGIGLEDAALPHIFEPFYTTARSEGSVGLGLYMVFNLVTFVLGGKINRSNDARQGVTFDITLPSQIIMTH
ncbi:tetratricopeptide repeat protein [Pseudoalteromonas luteoviolacea]|uniref:tetratricopeptide repeat protein n=1 Tax=Pseudoalteromonas luteoviolacea TaxID=43657 RepID=UPI001150E5E8|nr:tetratricopeptide repeat protein [Pseudoalteromonas luteoviolacea]TQF67647.1 tetratricopeptide repeat protein [Pseudoalteromonas luteoviolacea]